MRVNVRHMLNLAGNSAGGTFRHTLPELANNLQQLRDLFLAGKGQVALDGFFRIYVFGDESSSSSATAELSK